MPLKWSLAVEAKLIKVFSYTKAGSRGSQGNTRGDGAEFIKDNCFGQPGGDNPLNSHSPRRSSSSAQYVAAEWQWEGRARGESLIPWGILGDASTGAYEWYYYNKLNKIMRTANELQSN